MKPLKVEWYKQGDLSEIYQKTGYQFAFLTAPKHGNKQACDFVLCRDFLQDAVQAHLKNKSCSIHRFKYKHGSNPPLDMQRTRMLVTKAGITKAEVPKFREQIKMGQALLNFYEEMAGTSLSTVVKVSDNNKHVWRFRGPGIWMRSPVLISMYSFIIRLGDKVSVLKGFKDNNDLIKRLKELAENNAYGDNDSRYLRDCWDKMHLIMQNLDDLIFPKNAKTDPLFDSVTSTTTMHNNCGIHSLCAYTIPDKNLIAKLKKLHAADKKGRK